MKLANMKIRTKLLLIGVVVTLIPLSIIMVTVFSQNKKVFQVGQRESLNLAYADLDHIVDNIYTLAESHQEVTQKNINAALNVARDLLIKSGGITIVPETVEWSAVNQYTKASTKIEIPKMMVGDTWLGQVSAPNQKAFIVDPVKELLDVTCTIFQRMNPQGDMLRVSTNVLTAEGNRAIGTYIPSANADGTANPVVSTILKGQTYSGRAFVVDRWYITAYEPILDGAKNIVGVLYVGIPQENVKSLRQAIAGMKIGEKGFVTVLDSSGKYVIAHGGKKDGEDVSKEADAEGKTYIKERVSLAKKLSAREIGKQNFSLKNGGVTTKHDARFVYFQPWDWIIAAEANQGEFTKVADMLEDIGKSSNTMIALVGLVSLLLTALVWVFVANTIVKPINSAVASLKDIAQGEGDLTMRLDATSKDEIGELERWFNVFIEKLQHIIKDVSTGVHTLSLSSTELSRISEQMNQGAQDASNKSNNVAVAAEEMSANMNNVAAAMEQSTTNTNIVATASEEMSSTIGEIAQHAEKARFISGNATKKATEASENINALGDSAKSIGKVIETITEISEQVNLLALNATIEAARAGEAGKGFAVVANEIKELAKQTAAATYDIKDKVGNIQDTTTKTVQQISEINTVINDVHEVVGSIATAVEEQTAATAEIASNVNQMAQGIGEVNENVNQSSVVATEIAKEISDVSAIAGEMFTSSSQVSTSAHELSALADQLNQMVGQFKTA
ncbi:methyl-accepting chemotaxis protein [uncultured Desulfobulbus sp.]|uniref:methyl-accepting chemotaxis protein n=1 Tax=uncultured Desulfobulbus sp. TaxID=239745 RepID=UPI0029C657C8|nr:methyl-accepting chemotaxis protein [uncultured Desulfobulbus sp.]